MSVLFNLDLICSECGKGHLGGPCSAPCVCRCNRCNARLHCRGTPEKWAKPLSEAEALRRGMVLTSYGYVPAPAKQEAA